MAKKSYTSRLRKTRTGKLLKRTMGQSHFRAKKTGSQIRGKRKSNEVAGVDFKALSKHLHTALTG
ncbi:MAG: hypothetical protein COU08_02310 [Candidatus Harrisonbacteria bacterium CG10_big_fil_rev_8_21_14_0_10_42_17]|uniref:50S ribosomal protein L35 n=1 Tax=Candidatus Harrisonbacteria bacterium CG10_big_fil_rev_8_21_14_0_10_42_17 TaxID=1974584 RepID=A0A2M6WI42_9BACT|nr:MAG: hypothetical protein COU08_02310 [Candidatus Harrisonbacteria bacterium CG10_big_fil_rev_8_21_14_0_10_42_17]